jgi:hypothetical protein
MGAVWPMNIVFCKKSHFLKNTQHSSLTSSLLLRIRAVRSSNFGPCVGYPVKPFLFLQYFYRFDPRQGQRTFPLSSVSRAHPASCPMGTGGPFPGGKARSGRDADHSPPSSAEV